MRPNKRPEQPFLTLAGSVVLTATVTLSLAFGQAPQPSVPASSTKPRQNAPEKAGVDKKNEEQRQKRMLEARIVLRPIALAELQFIRNVCDPSKEQASAIARDVGLQLRDLSRELAAKTAGENSQALDAEFLSNDNIRRLEESITVFAKNRLRSDQWERYTNEGRKRVDDRKQCVISNTIAALDKRLVFSQSQRRQISEVLASGWANAQASTSFIFNEDTYPSVPEHLLVPLLTPSQKAIWKSLKVPDKQSREASSLYHVIAEIDRLISGSRSDDEQEIDRAMNLDFKPANQK